MLGSVQAGGDGAPAGAEIPTLLSLHCCAHVHVCICVCVCWEDIQHTEWWQSELFLFLFFTEVLSAFLDTFWEAEFPI